MIGAYEFKAMYHDMEDAYNCFKNMSAIEPFYNRVFLFSINDGDGFNYQMSLLSNLATKIEEEKVEVKHIKLKLPDILDAEDPKRTTDRDIVLHTLKTSDALSPGSYRIMCLDIRDWIDKCEGPEFRAVLARLKDTLMDQRVIFRIPAVDEATLMRVKECIGWFMDVKEVYTPPFSLEQYMEYADALLKERGIELDAEAHSMLEKLISKEKQSFSFWGFKSVKTIVDSIVISHLRLRYGAIEPNET